MRSIANITPLTPTLSTGGDLPADRATAARHIADWRGRGIRRVVDCRVEWTDADLVAELAPDIEYVHLGIDDAGQRVPGTWFDRLVDAVDGGPSTLVSTLVPTLVHCHMGINRGPSAAYAVLLARGYDPVDAIDLIRTRRPIAAVGYAEDALEWWMARTGADGSARAAARTRLAAWRAVNPPHPVRFIRAIRAAS